mmetsp:Transcript_110947/g.353758  ORF Transcript_110947/g.353758 Transcript_110947/m.353758 type:complete len:258 (-) Transcript_110947:43-816(-)
MKGVQPAPCSLLGVCVQLIPKRGNLAWFAASAALALALRAVLPPWGRVQQRDVGELTRPNPAAAAESSATIAEPWLHPETSLRDYPFLRERVAEEYGWTEERVDGAITEYLRFLQLLADAPSQDLIASSDVDLVWHEHIMDTLNYAADCRRIFGHFLHHRRARTPEEQRMPVGRPPSQFWGENTTAASMCGGGSNIDPYRTVPAPAPSGGSSAGVTTTPVANVVASRAPAAATTRPLRTAAVALASAAVVAPLARPW